MYPRRHHSHISTEERNVGNVVIVNELSEQVGYVYGGFRLAFPGSQQGPPLPSLYNDVDR
jgi:hypothetical protein